MSERFIAPSDELFALRAVESAAEEVFTGPWSTKPGIVAEKWFVARLKHLGKMLDQYWQLQQRADTDA